MSSSERVPKQDLNSLCYWYPKIRDHLRTPETMIVEVPYWTLVESIDKISALDPFMPEIYRCADALGYPVFMRTDQSSDKHNWVKTCFVEKKENLRAQIRNTCEFNAMCDMMGLPMRAIVLRKFLHLKTCFTAFGGMPVAREFRLFSTDGKLDCFHPYWPEDAIEFRWKNKAEFQKARRAKGIKPGDFDALEALHDQAPRPADWKQQLREISRCSEAEAELLKGMACMATAIVGGSWSVDLCQTETGEWYLTDMAVAEDSYHMPHQDLAGKTSEAL